MRIYIKPPYTDRNVVDSSYDGDNIDDIVTMTRQDEGCSQSWDYKELHDPLLHDITWLW